MQIEGPSCRPPARFPSNPVRLLRARGRASEALPEIAAFRQRLWVPRSIYTQRALLPPRCSGRVGEGLGDTGEAHARATARRRLHGAGEGLGDTGKQRGRPKGGPACAPFCSWRQSRQEQNGGPPRVALGVASARTGPPEIVQIEAPGRRCPRSARQSSAELKRRRCRSRRRRSVRNGALVAARRHEDSFRLEPPSNIRITKPIRLAVTIVVDSYRVT